MLQQLGRVLQSWSAGPQCLASHMRSACWACTLPAEARHATRPAACSSSARSAPWSSSAPPSTSSRPFSSSSSSTTTTSSTSTSSTSSPGGGVWQQHLQGLRRAHSYSQQSGTPAPEPWPVLGALKQSSQHAGRIKLHQSVVRLPSGLQPSMQGTTLVLSGRAGTVRLDLPQLDPLGLVAYKLLGAGEPEAQPAPGPQHGSTPRPSPFLLVASPDKGQFDAIMLELDRSIEGCMQGFLVGLTVKGVGYRLEPVEEPVTRTSWYFEQGQYDKSTIAYPHTKPVTAVRLKVGFSRTVIYPLPPDVRAFAIKPTLLYLYGLQLPRLQQIARDIRAIRKPNAYTGNGIALVGEELVLKQRSTRKK